MKISNQHNGINTSHTKKYGYMKIFIYIVLQGYIYNVNAHSTKEILNS